MKIDFVPSEKELRSERTISGVSEWTEVQTKDLIKYWNSGLTSGEISKKLNKTKAAVLGKIDRLKRKGVKLVIKNNSYLGRK